MELINLYYHPFLPHNTLEGSCGILNQNVNKANDNNKSACIIVIKMYIYSMLIGNTTIY